MKKILISIIAATMCLASCTTKDGEEASVNKKNNRQIPVKTTLCHYWFDPTSYHNCLEAKASDSLCYIKVGCNDKNSMPATASISGNKLDKLIIKTSLLNSFGFQSAYTSYLNDGNIRFYYDCPIYDTVILTNINTNYIPAGTYLIEQDDSTVVIYL